MLFGKNKKLFCGCYYFITPWSSSEPKGFLASQGWIPGALLDVTLIRKTVTDFHNKIKKNLQSFNLISIEFNFVKIICQQTKKMKDRQTVVNSVTRKNRKMSIKSASK